jgi:hypothetical protein
METKEQLVSKIKDWVAIDKEIIGFRKEIRERNIRKKMMSSELMNVMKENKIDCFDINDGSIVYKKNKVKKPINAKTLLSSLNKFFNDDVKKAEEVTAFILENREIQEKGNISLKTSKT